MHKNIFLLTMSLCTLYGSSYGSSQPPYAPRCKEIRKTDNGTGAEHSRLYQALQKFDNFVLKNETSTNVILISTIASSGLAMLLPWLEPKMSPSGKVASCATGLALIPVAHRIYKVTHPTMKKPNAV